MKLNKVIFIVVFLLVITGHVVLAEQDVIKEQEDALGITNLINESEGYTSDVYEDVSLNEIFDEAISGKINNSKVLKNVLNII